MKPGSSVPVLIVDDNATKRLAIRSVVEPLGYAITEADSGLAALRAVLVKDFAVILLDVRMPIMDGYETAALIRLREQSEMTPIIFITAHGKDEIAKADRYAEGAVDFMFAPVAPDELRAKVSVFGNLYLRAQGLATRAREVQESTDHLRLLTDAAPIGMFQTDAENRYLYTNPRWTELTGISSAEAAGRAWDSIISEPQRALVRAEPAEGAPDRIELSHRFHIDRPGAAKRIVHVTSRSLPDRHGGIAGWIGTLADVTAVAGAEAAMAAARDQANQASQQKSDFLANMSHEIRTPMNGVIGMADLLLETTLDDRQRDFAETVRSSATALLGIINDILDFSKVEAGKLTVEDAEFDVEVIVDDVLDLLSSAAQVKDLALVSVIGPDVPVKIGGDAGRVRQVLTNLIGNAIKFTSAGEVVVRVAAEDDGPAERIIRFEISDTGDGISDDKLELIFQPFIQGDSSTSRTYGGTGLGLAISSQLVTLMGGDCGVTSRLHHGSTFWFTISDHTPPEAATAGGMIPDPRLDGVSVLIVDDNAPQRQVLSSYLTGWGMAVKTAGSGHAGLATLRTAAIHGRPFAVALVDRVMPGIDGVATARATRADPALDVRVVLMTELGQDRDLGSYEDAGIAAHLSKPIHRRDLQRAVLVALELEASPGHVARDSTEARGNETDGEQAGRILLAEHNIISQKIALTMLVAAGYRVDAVRTAPEAITAVAATRYDAVLLDPHLPGLDGLAAAAAIRDRADRNEDLPIIALVTEAQRCEDERCLADGMDAFLVKPLEKALLLDLVRQSVTHGRTRQPVAVER